MYRKLIEDTATMVDLQESVYFPIHEETGQLALPCTPLLALGHLARWRSGRKENNLTNKCIKNDRWCAHTFSAQQHTTRSNNTIRTKTKDIPIREETVQLALPCTPLLALGHLSEHMGTTWEPHQPPSPS